MQLAIYSIISLIGAALTVILADMALPLIIAFFFAYLFGLLFIHFMMIFLGSRFIHTDRLPDKTKPFHRFITLSTVSLILSFMRVRVTVRGRELLPEQPFVFISNHFSVYDPMIAMLHLRKHRLAFVSKKENIQIPMAGRFMLAYGCVSLDRGSSRKAVEVINKAAENITSGRCSMGIYPEGGTNRDPDNVLLKPFKSGSFKLALKARAPIVVAVMSNTRRINRQLFTHVTMDIIRVFTYEEYKDMKTGELSELAYETMKEWLINK